MGSRILVTGARGTIGAPLVNELRQRGHGVLASDLQHSADTWYARCDVSEFRQLQELFDKHGPFDYVFHLAAEFGRWNGEANYERLWRTNAIGTKHLLTLQAKHQFKLIFFSSSEVYGDWPSLMTEDVMDKNEVKQLNDYAISKWVNEMQILNSAAMHGTKTVRVRLFNVYGPGEHFTPYRSVVCRFIYDLLHYQRITVHKGHTRSSTYVDDAVRTIATIAEEFSPGKVYNIGSSRRHSVEDLSNTILKILGKDDSLVDYKPEEPFTTKDKIVDCTAAERDLNHREEVSLEDGLRRTCEWMAQVYGRTIPKKEASPVGLSELDSLVATHKSNPGPGTLVVLRDAVQTVCTTKAPRKNVILHVHNVARIGGTGNFVHDFARCFPEFQHVALHVNDPNGEPAWLNAVSHAMRPIYAPKLTRELLEEIDPLIVMMHNTAGQSVEGGHKLEICHDRHVIFVHHNPTHPLFVENVATDVFVSQFVMNKYSSILDRMKARRLIPPCCDLSGFESQRTWTHPKLSFTTAGKGCDKLYAWAEREQLELDRGPRRAMGALPSHLKNFDVAIIWSGLQESWCRTVTECMAAGMIVVAHHVGAIPEQIEPWKTGFLFKDEAELSMALRKIERMDIPARVEISARARAWALANAGFQRMRNEYYPLLTQALLKT